MDLCTLPLFGRLADARSVLIAGAGGGFDVYAGLPLLFALEALGKEVHLANLSFSDLRPLTARPLHEAHVPVTADSGGAEDYFPEKHLCRWFRRRRGRDITVHAFPKVGVAPLTEAYRALASDLGVDALVLVDGGTDSLMRGDEAGLGTPVEDVASIAAARALPLETKVLACLGFGVDAFHGVAHWDVLEATAELARSGGYLGAFSLMAEMPEAQAYAEALDFVHAAAPSRPSIVNSSIASAVAGHFGDHHTTVRTAGSELFINPLMSLYFSYELDLVADRITYLPALAHTETAFEIAAIIEAHRAGRALRPRRRIPL